MESHHMGAQVHIVSELRKTQQQKAYQMDISFKFPVIAYVNFKVIFVSKNVPLLTW